MNKSTSSILAAMLVALTMGVGSSGAAVAQDEGKCIQGRLVQKAIDDGYIVGLADAMSAAGIKEKPLSPPEVCKVDGVTYYRVNVMNAYGEAERIDLNAEDGTKIN